MSNAEASLLASMLKVNTSKHTNYRPTPSKTPSTTKAAHTNKKKQAHRAPSAAMAEPCTWTKKESDALKIAVDVHKSKNWKKIVVAVGGKKTEEQCMFHWRNVLCPVVVKGKGSWTPEEDLALQALVQKHGRTKWSFIGRFLPGRVGKQCRERWHNHLNPDLKKVPWDEEEEKLIVRMRAELGNRWAKIARALPGRSDNDVKNRWYASLRKRVDEDGDPSILLPKKKRAKDKKKKSTTGAKRKRKTKKEKKEQDFLLQQQQKNSSSNMSAMFNHHLPLRKRPRVGSLQLSIVSGKSTPVRPQKSEGASMLLGMAAFLDNSASGIVVNGETDDVNADDVNDEDTVEIEQIVKPSPPPVNVNTKSGAKMLADAEFLVSFGVPVVNPSSPGGLRTLVARN